MKRDPQTLHPHPLIKHMPRADKGSVAWRSFIDDIRANGIKNPIIGTHSGVVADGWTRAIAARDLQLAEVPYVEIPDDEVVQTIFREMCQKRGLTKGQKAYLAWERFKPLHAEMEAKRLAALKAGRNVTLLKTSADSIGTGRSEDAFGAEIGVSGDLVRQARELHEVFAGTRRELSSIKLTETAEEIRNFWEPRILDLDKPIGLGAAIAGIAGKTSTEGHEKGTSPITQLDLFSDGLKALETVFEPKRWAKTEHVFQDRMVTDFTLAAAAWPMDLRRRVAAALLAGSDEDPAA
jgi:hypothetical protein